MPSFQEGKNTDKQKYRPVIPGKVTATTKFDGLYACFQWLDQFRTMMGDVLAKPESAIFGNQ